MCLKVNKELTETYFTHATPLTVFKVINDRGYSPYYNLKWEPGHWIEASGDCVIKVSRVENGSKKYPYVEGGSLHGYKTLKQAVEFRDILFRLYGDNQKWIVIRLEVQPKDVVALNYSEIAFRKVYYLGVELRRMGTDRYELCTGLGV